MKILHILYSGLGGHGNVFFSLVKADKNKLFEQVALFAGVEELREEYKQRCDENGITWKFLKKTPGLDISFYMQMLGYIKRIDPQIIFLHGSANILPAKFLKMFSGGKRKIIVRETQANALKTKMEWKWLKLALKYADTTVFLSDTYNEEVKKAVPGLYRSERIAVIPNGIDLDIFKPGEKIINDETILGMQSRIVDIKDHTTLLQALAIVKQQQPTLKIKLKIAGDGSYRQVLEAQARELNIEPDVEFMGTLDQPALVSFIRSLDIYIHASLGETMSTAIMQAMACKKAIIASDVPGINNMISNNETGMLVKAKDAGSMAGAILQLTGDTTLTAQLADKAHRFALDHYSNTIMFERYKKLFNS